MNLKTSKSIISDYLKASHEENFIYHVTSDYYKLSILKTGLKRKFAITKDHIDSLKSLCEDENFIDLNENLDFGCLGQQSIIDKISETFESINDDHYPLSFSYSHSDIINYLNNETKGGQYLKYLRILIKNVVERFQTMDELENIIDHKIFEIIDFIKNVDRSNFLLCIVDKSNLREYVNDDLNRFQTLDDVSVNDIIELIEFN